jgi:hypothetical protein
MSDKSPPTESDTRAPSVFCRETEDLPAVMPLDRVDAPPGNEVNELQYRFESDADPRHRSLDRAKPEMLVLIRRLGFISDEVRSYPFGPQMIKFVATCNLAIDWYQRRISREVRLRELYFYSSLGVLAVVPIALFWAGSSAAGLGASTTAQVSAIIAGIFAFYRGLSAWLDKRQVVGGFSKASSDLKEILYGFEERWAGEATKEELAPQFYAALVAATHACRDIVRRETDEYFVNLSYPSLDIGGILRGAQRDAAGLVSDVAKSQAGPRSVDATAVRTAAGAGSRTDSTRIDMLQKEIERINVALEAAQKAGDTKTISDLRSEREQRLLQLRGAQIDAAASLTD